MKKKSVYANITPIPSHIPRQLAIDMLHSHGEIIELNPLVTGFNAIKAPQNASPDEYFSTWYEIHERIQYVPGVGKMGSGKISFKGCFHDMPWGLQTHVYAPMGVDLRNKWQIRGNQPGEPPESRELGSGAPAEGLYLREDIEIKCNPAMVSFVKKEMKAASKTMVDRLVKKAELIDAGVLSAMMENGRLKTLNPADRSRTQTMGPNGLFSPSVMSPSQSYPPPTSPGFAPPSAYPRQSQYGAPPVPAPHGLAIEMPGSMHYAESSQHLHPPNTRYSSAMSELTASSPNQGSFPSGTGSTSDRQSYAESVSSHPSSHGQGGMTSPSHDKRAFVAELPASHAPVSSRSPRTSDAHATASPHSPQGQYRYNPQDYARMS